MGFVFSPGFRLGAARAIYHHLMAFGLRHITVRAAFRGEAWNFVFQYVLVSLVPPQTEYLIRYVMRD